MKKEYSVPTVEVVFCAEYCLTTELINGGFASNAGEGDDAIYD